MTMKEEMWRKALVWAVTLFMAVMLIMIIQAMILQAETMLDGNVPRKVMFMLVMLSILAFYVFERVLRWTVRAIVVKRTDRKESPRTESDPLVSWMRIIFSKEE